MAGVLSSVGQEQEARPFWWLGTARSGKVGLHIIELQQ